jgi:hypothetical protein
LPPIKWGSVPDCALESDKPVPPWCTTKASGPTTIMTIDPSAAKQFAVALHYTDERFPGQPVACVRAYRYGQMQAELCDPQPRKEGWWDAGTLDALSGKTPEGLAQEKAAQAAAQAAAQNKAAAMVAAAKAADGGSPESGAGGSPDAGAARGREGGAPAATGEGGAPFAMTAAPAVPEAGVGTASAAKTDGGR